MGLLAEDPSDRSQPLTLPSGTTVQSESVWLPNGLTGTRTTIVMPGESTPLVTTPSGGYAPQHMGEFFATDPLYTAEQRDRDLAVVYGRVMGPQTLEGIAAVERAKVEAAARLNAHWNQSALPTTIDGTTVLPSANYSPVELVRDLSLANTTGPLDELSENLRDQAEDRLGLHAYTPRNQLNDQVYAQLQYLGVDHPDRRAEVDRLIASGVPADQAQQVLWHNSVAARQRLAMTGTPLLPLDEAKERQNTLSSWAHDPRVTYIPDNSPYDPPHDFTETDFRNFIGELTGLKDLTEGIESGDYGQAAFGGAVTLLTFVPGLGVVIGGGVGKLGRSAWGRLGRWADPEGGAGAAGLGREGLGAGPATTGLGGPYRGGRAPNESGNLDAPWNQTPPTAGLSPDGKPPGMPSYRPQGGNHGNADNLSGFNPPTSPWKQPRPNYDRPWDLGYNPYGTGLGGDRRAGWYSRYGRSNEPDMHLGAGEARPPLTTESRPYKGLPQDAEPGVVPDGIVEVQIRGHVQWYDVNANRYVTMPEWAKTVPPGYVKAQSTPVGEFTLTPAAQADIARVQAARDSQDMVVVALRSERDEIASKMNVNPRLLTNKYLDEIDSELLEVYGHKRVQSLRDAMSDVNAAEWKSNKLTETMGNIAARDYIHRMGGEVITGLDDAATGSGTLDVVGIVGGKLVVVEAKGGGATLGTRMVDGGPDELVRVQQGTPQYLKWMLDNDPKLAQALKDRGLLDAVRNGEMDVVYDLVRYDPKAGRPEVSRFNIEDELFVPPDAIKKILTTGEAAPTLPRLDHTGVADVSALVEDGSVSWIDSLTQSLQSAFKHQASLAVPAKSSVAISNRNMKNAVPVIDKSLQVTIFPDMRRARDSIDEINQFLTYSSIAR